MGFFDFIFGNKRERLADQVSETMKYCPKCGDEYRPDFERCAVCDCDLVDGHKKHAALKELDRVIDGRNMHIGEDDDLVDLQKGPMKDMKQLKEVLRKHYIPALLLSEGPCGACCGGPELLLRVRREDIEMAAHILSQELIASTHLKDHDIKGMGEVFNPDRGDNICPACGTKFDGKGGVCPDCGLCF